MKAKLRLLTITDPNKTEQFNPLRIWPNFQIWMCIVHSYNLLRAKTELENNSLMIFGKEMEDWSDEW